MATIKGQRTAGATLNHLHSSRVRRKGQDIMDEFRQGIIKMINEIEDINMLEYLHEFIRLQMEREEQ